MNMNLSTATTLETMSTSLKSRSTALMVTEVALFGLLITVTLLGNFLTLLAVFRNSRLRTIPNLFTISLAVSDLGMGILCMPLSITVLATSRWTFGAATCQYEGYIAIVMAAASTQTLAITAVNRYFGIVKCLLYRMYFTTRRTIYLILGVWGLSIVAPLPYLITGNSFVFHPGKFFCYVSLDAAWYTVFLVSVYVGIPSVVILFCYVRVFQTIAARNKHYQETRESQNVSVEEIKVTRILFVIVLFYLLCWSPVLIIDFIDTILGRYAAPRSVYAAYTFLAAVSSSANPVIYGIMNRSFRSEYMRLLLCHEAEGHLREASNPATLKLGTTNRNLSGSVINASDIKLSNSVLSNADSKSTRDLIEPDQIVFNTKL